MTSPAAVATPPGALSVRALSALVALAGAAFYGFVALSAMHVENGHFGTLIYDELFLTIMAGELSLPARLLSWEGHYHADGTGYLYHGVGPLITRFLAAPFVEIGTISLSTVSVWLWAVVGTALYHATFLKIAARHWPAGAANAPLWAGMLGIAAWLASPGMYFASNHSIYMEPIALAYAATAGFVYLWFSNHLAGRHLVAILVPLGALAAVALHARPNIAIGLYGGAVLAIGWSLWTLRARALLPAVLSLALMGASGLGLLALNKARFGDPTTTHGALAEAKVQHGVIYWGFDSEDSPRSSAYMRAGRFNLARVPANLAMYTLTPAPLGGVMDEAFFKAIGWHRAAAASRGDYQRLEGPGGGMLGMWMPWVVLAFAGLALARSRMRPHAGLLVATGTAALLMLAYPTVTLRYHIDVWPFVAVLAAIALAVLTPKLAGARFAGFARTSFLATLLVSMVVVQVTAAAFRLQHANRPGTLYRDWSEAECRMLAAARGFTMARRKFVCRAPRAPAAKG